MVCFCAAIAFGLDLRSFRYTFQHFERRIRRMCVKLYICIGVAVVSIHFHITYYIRIAHQTSKRINIFALDSPGERRRRKREEKTKATNTQHTAYYYCTIYTFTFAFAFIRVYIFARFDLSPSFASDMLLLVLLLLPLFLFFRQFGFDSFCFFAPFVYSHL